MWTYAQSTGQLSRNGQPIAIGYSGFGEGKNNPALQGISDVGPIPRGDYTIGPPECVDVAGPHGPYVLRLTPHQAMNRDGFLIHGDSMEHPGQASHGCIILARGFRSLIAVSHDTHLTVIAS